MLVLPEAFRALSFYAQFIVYRLEPKKDKPGKMDKLPIDAGTGYKHSAHDPAIWLTFEAASEAAQRLGAGHGVGFAFTNEDPFFFVDLDNCLIGGAWTPAAIDICARFSGAAVEVSQSGSGLHIIGSYTSIPDHACEITDLGGFYHWGRFCALTGLQAKGDAGADMSSVLPAVISDYYPPTPSNSSEPAEWGIGAMEGYDGPADDDELIAKARASGGSIAGAVFSNRATFDDLWTANGEALGKAYPDNFGARLYDESSADAALASRLAFWTGCDCERIERIMWLSGLVREKWTAHSSYMQRTITGAVGKCDTIYTGKRPATESKPDPVELVTSSSAIAELAEGFQYMAPAQQMSYFNGCIYVQDVHRVFTPRGTLLRPDQFRATYGGYLFVMDMNNDKTTKSAWEAFTESQAVRYPMAESLTFRPEEPPGQMLQEEGREVVNTYTPAIVRRAEGDASPFLNHLAALLPDPYDYAIALAYMAACVQHIGVKFQWAPLFQGAPGNGKTLLTRCVSYAVGMKYSHFPKADEMGGKFNSWMLNKVFIGVEDIYVPGHRQDILSSLLPLITNDILPIELKGVDQISARVCANFILNCNPKDGLRKVRDDRRFAIFFTAQQSAADIQRDGMGGSYFPDLYSWLKGDGYAIVAEYLATYEIPDELNPGTYASHRAPITSSTNDAIEHGVGHVEQEIMEAIEEGRPGFAGGWVSSIALDKLLESIRMTRAIPPNRRREVLQSLGYDWHPALLKGRVNNPTTIDRGKPRLFIKAKHSSLTLECPADVARAYQDAQASPLAEAVFNS
jgi:hypothetical protein